MQTTEDIIKINRLGKNELSQFRELVQLFTEVFETPTENVADDSQLLALLENPGFLTFTVTHNDVIAGGATAYILAPYYTRLPELFIYDVAIATQHQRKGLGAKLVAALKQHCRENNIGEMFVPAHEEDTHALDFYRSTGGTAEKVVLFTYDTMSE